MTWQASARNKINLFSDFADSCICRALGAVGQPPETGNAFHFRPSRLHQATWSAPMTNRLLLDAGFSATILSFPGFLAPGVEANHVSILEQSTGILYNARAKEIYHKALGPLVKEPWLARLDGPSSEGQAMKVANDVSP